MRNKNHPKWRHGLSRTNLNKLWIVMRQRCNNPKTFGYHNYGGRGIRVCERWDDFTKFSDDVGPRPSMKHSLDRINNDGNYEPGNVRWVLKKEQFRNMRRNVWLNFSGLRMTQQEFCDLIGITDGNFSTFKRKKGGAMEAALFLMFVSPTYRTRYAPELCQLSSPESPV
jgi:hypothetical protein